jgi:hypothetical protein
MSLREIPYRPSRSAMSRLTMLSALEDRIRLLTDRAIAAKTQPELEAILRELKAAVRDLLRYLRANRLRQ